MGCSMQSLFKLARAVSFLGVFAAGTLSAQAQSLIVPNMSSAEDFCSAWNVEGYVTSSSDTSVACAVPAPDGGVWTFSWEENSDGSTYWEQDFGDLGWLYGGEYSDGSTYMDGMSTSGYFWMYQDPDGTMYSQGLGALDNLESADMAEEMIYGIGTSF